jgi:hypothetical protein
MSFHSTATVADGVPDEIRAQIKPVVDAVKA